LGGDASWGLLLAYVATAFVTGVAICMVGRLLFLFVSCARLASYPPGCSFYFRFMRAGKVCVCAYFFALRTIRSQCGLLIPFFNRVSFVIGPLMWGYYVDR
jgi:hypothetical protein